jgi:hypothetical protein
MSSRSISEWQEAMTETVFNNNDTCVPVYEEKSAVLIRTSRCQAYSVHRFKKKLKPEYHLRWRVRS